MRERLVLLHLTPQPKVLLRANSGESPAALVVRALTRWPFLPVTHLSCNGALLGTLRSPSLSHPEAPTAAPVPKRKRKQGYTERYRQHWIDKDNAKKSS